MSNYKDNLKMLSESETHTAWVVEADSRVRKLANSPMAVLTLVGMFGYLFGVLYILH